MLKHGNICEYACVTANMLNFSAVIRMLSNLGFGRACRLRWSQLWREMLGPHFIKALAAASSRICRDGVQMG